MSRRGDGKTKGFGKWAPALAACLLLTACADSRAPDDPFAPGVDPGGAAVDGVAVGNRLMEAGEYDLALDAFTRAALDQGMTTEILTSLGTANMGLGRLGQAEPLLRRAVADDPDWPPAWNNLGVLLIERGEYAEAANVLQKAYALDNGESDAIRDNLRLALANSEKPDIVAEEQDFKIVRRGESEFAILKSP